MANPFDVNVNLYRGSHTPKPIDTLSLGETLEWIRAGH